MAFPTYFNSKKTLNLYGLSSDFQFFKTLYNKNELPKVLMLSGKKGSGKSTLINHLMFYIFDKDNNDEKNQTITSNSVFNKQLVIN